MNEIQSLFLASIVLAVSGIGFYIYKSSDLDEETTENNNTYDEYQEEYEPEIYEVKTKNVKTKRTRRKSLGTKRRY